MPIDSSETISRFIFQKSQYKTSDNTVKYTAFIPSSKNGETSVFCTYNINDEEIWNIGREVSVKRGKPVLGRADIIADVVTSQDLEIIPSEPPERHADITGWPDERSEQRLIALELAEEAHLHLKS